VDLVTASTFDTWWQRRSVWPAVPVSSLVAAKRGRTVSVVIPALQEAETVAGVVGPLHDELVPAGLVDEVVVVDGGSTDGTAGIAERAGARVLHLPEECHGYHPRGKGGALWWAQQHAEGDVLVFLDADVVPSRAQTAVALLTPLLLDEGVQFVKAAFDRPLTVDGVLHRGSGGRVTEMLARPLLNAWWPELSGFVQPLAGELAATRALLAEVPCATGYALEIAMLVDVLRLVGIEAMAQADIGERQHRHQSDEALGRLAGEILAAAIDRRGAGPRADTLLQFRRDGAGFAAVTTDVQVAFLPPVASVVKV
jgi:glucosyl-3-phosphoglycerate synthase